MQTLMLDPVQEAIPVKISLRQASIEDANALLAARLWQTQEQLSSVSPADVRAYLKATESIQNSMLSLVNPGSYTGVYEQQSQAQAFVQLEARSFPKYVYELTMEEGLAHPSYTDKRVHQPLLQSACRLELFASHLNKMEQLELLKCTFEVAQEKGWTSVWFSVWQYDRGAQMLALEFGMTLLGYDRLPERVGHRRIHKMIYTKTP